MSTMKLGLTGILASVCMTLGLAAQAATVDFVQRENSDATYPHAEWGECLICYVSDGFSFDVDGWADDIPGTGVHLDDDGLKTTYIFREDGLRFSVRRLFFGGEHASRAFVTGSEPAPEVADPFAPGSAFYDWLRDHSYDGLTFGLYGMRGTSIVATLEFASAQAGWMKLGREFRHLDALQVAILRPVGFRGYGEIPYDGLPNSVWCEQDTCTTVNITKMKATVHPAPVPLPASFPLLAAGVALVAWIGSKRRSFKG